ncbi:hypothetical protein P7M77_03050 [Vibrio parahaemolyticus]|nr:hypothetical protein [Vibrio parahaemolyticus]MDG2729010.1 hypothetical protein [Vibrio parahaemolyticus]HBC3392778.1 hypothetical protein [Vibrio parahaemolyticus]HBC3577902.1 hypothetical protein [Vibrio parahaemolyticus]HBC3951026.1 hypothetical protein [Vibrio parahaemolyticus]
MKRKFDPSKREFITYSSASALALVFSSSFLPKTVFAAPGNQCEPNKSFGHLSLYDLDNINFYTKSTDALRCVGLDTLSFEQPIDEVQLISNVIFNEIMKQIFLEQHNDIATSIGGDMLPNAQVLGMFDGINHVYEIKNKYNEYLVEIMPEFISQIIQGHYQDPNNYIYLSDIERRKINSWNMISINSATSKEAANSQFISIMEDITSIACSFASSSSGAHLHRYKLENPDIWISELYNWYCEDSKLESRVNSMDISSFGHDNAYHNTMSLISIFGILNRACRDKGLNVLSQEKIHKMNETLSCSIHIATAKCVQWGDLSEKYSALNNTEGMREILYSLRNNADNEVASFWKLFLDKYGINNFISKLRNSRLEGTSIFSEDSEIKLQSFYPEFIDPINDKEVMNSKRMVRGRLSSKLSSPMGVITESGVEGNGLVGGILVKKIQSKITKRIIIGSKVSLAPSAMLNSFLFLLSTTHYFWSTTASDENQADQATSFGIATQLFDTVSNIGYYAAVKAISSYMKKMSPAKLSNGVAHFERYATFWLNAKNARKLIDRPIKNIAHAIFNQSIIAKVVNKVSFVLSVVGLYYALNTLSTSVLDKDTNQIVFEALNVVVSGISVASGISAFLSLSFAGPLGLIALAAGGILLIAKIVYDILNPTIKIHPITQFTDQVLEARSMLYPNKGTFLSNVVDSNGFSYIKHISMKTLDLTGANNVNLELKESIAYPNAITISNSKRNMGKIFSFDRRININNNKASFQNLSFVEDKGFENTLDWSQEDSRIIRIVASVESTSRFWDTKALFLCEVENNRKAIYMTNGLDVAPRYGDRVYIDSTEHGDIKDIISIDDQDTPTLLVLSNKYLFQVKRNYTVKKISNNFLENINDTEITSYELYKSACLAHIVIRYPTYEYENGNVKINNHATFYTISKSETYNEYYDRVTEGITLKINNDDQLVSRSRLERDNHYVDFLILGNDSYRRVSAILSSDGIMIENYSEGLALPSVYPISKAILLKNTYSDIY